MGCIFRAIYMERDMDTLIVTILCVAFAFLPMFIMDAALTIRARGKYEPLRPHKLRFLSHEPTEDEEFEYND